MTNMFPRRRYAVIILLVGIALPFLLFKLPWWSRPRKMLTPIFQFARPESNPIQEIVDKACAIHLAFLDAKPGTVTPLSFYEYLDISPPGPGARDLDISIRAFGAASRVVEPRDGFAAPFPDKADPYIKAANMLMNERERSVYDTVILRALRGEGDSTGNPAEKAAAGLTTACGWGA